ncbi:GSCOCG00008704001-RA-CDS [Cotesia congregata]|nr:GSCOCG00008704001-RA-CDS [Cotesia congregata]
MENTLIRRKKMQGIKGIGWRRRAEQRMIRMEEQIEEVIKINKNDEKFVGNTVNLEESIVIENGEQITKIQGVAFTSTQLTDALRQPTMKKILCTLVPVVWSPAMIEKNYLKPPTATGDYHLINDADKLTFDQLCLHLQHRRKILFKKGSADDLEIYSKTWLARRCTEL